MAAIDDAVKVNSKCFFTYEIKDSQGDGTGMYCVKEQEIQSRTFLPEGTVVFSHKEWKEFVKEIKKQKYKFKESDLDDKMKEKFDEDKIKYETDISAN